MKYPYLYAAAAYAAGSFLYSKIPLEFMLVFFPAVVLCCLIRMVFCKNRSFNIIILTFFFVLGNFLCNFVFGNENSPLYDFENQYVSVIGRIDDVPKYDEMSGRYTYMVDVDYVKYKNNLYAVKSDINVSAENKFEYGAVIEAKGFLKGISEQNNSSDFDYKKYYNSKGIYYKLYSYPDYCYVLKSVSKPNSLGDVYNQLRAYGADIAEGIFPKEEGALLRYILIGDSSYISDDFDKQLVHSGAVSFLNSAYINIAILMWIMAGIASLLRLPKRVYDLIIILMLVLFAGMHTAQSSFVKYAAVIIFYKIYIYKNGVLYIPDALPFAVLILMILNPAYLFMPGFIMSVAATVMIFIFKPYVAPCFGFIKNIRLKNTVAVFAVLTVGLIPVCAYLFYGMPLYSVIFAVFMTPIIIAVKVLTPVMSGIVWLIGRADALYYSVYFMLVFVKSLIKFVAGLPMSYIYLPAPDLVQILFFYLMLFIIKDILSGERRHFKLKSAAAALSLVCIISSGVYRMNSINFSFVNVGQGDGAVVWVPYREVVLIDGGGSEVYSSYDIGEKVFCRYLASIGRTSIDIAVATHYHKDHCEGIIAAMENFKVKRLLIPDCDEGNEWRTRLEEAAKNGNTEIIYIGKGDSIRFPSGLTMDILSPDDNLLYSEDLNDTSIVVDISYGEVDALFTGDMTVLVEERLLENGIKDSYEILKVPHHGSATSSTEEFLEKVKPEYSVIGVGENNNYGLPDEEVLSRIEQNSGEVLRTDIYGDITITADKRGIRRVSHFKDGE